jgi:hypothetical protein
MTSDEKTRTYPGSTRLSTAEARRNEEESGGEMRRLGDEDIW